MEVNMKKKIVSLLLVLVMCVTMLPIVSFAAGTMEVKVSADNTSPKSGDIVTFTVAIGAVADLTTMDFVIDVPAGMTYVENSATLQEGLKETLKVAAADWTELTKKFTMYGDSSYSSTGDTTIMTFKCKVDDGASGTLNVSVKELAASDSEYETIETTITPATVTIPGAHTHVFDQKNTDAKYLASAASCTAKATYYYSCTCGEKGTATFESGETLPHTPSTVWSKDETNHWHVCTVCNVEMDKAAHTPDHEGGATETYPIKCTECGYVIEAQLDHTHSFTQEVAEAKYLKSAAGCDAPAVYYKSCTCGEASTTETFTVGTALGHSYTAEKVADQYLKDAAGCETDAVYFKSCARCGAKGTETFTVANSALGHKGGAWQSDETGHWKVCERVNCGKRFNEGTHDGGKATCQAKAACTTCGAAYGKLGEHNFDTKWTSDDTYHFHKCLTAGCTEKADEAKHSSTGDNAANCLHKAKCDVCAAEYGDLGAHTLTKTAAKAPTCLEAGNNEYYTCSVCGKVFKVAAGTTETTVAAETLAKSTTHSVVKGEYATSATEHWQICKVCGTVVGKAAHKFGEADANGRKTCADCGYTVGGTGTEGHKHAAGNTICYDENNHWNKCTDDNCDAHVNESAHKFGPKNTVTEGNKTITIETCSECGYVKRTETTTGGTTPVNPGGNNPSKPGRPSGTKTVQSGKTFDAGVGVYVGLSILSLTGSAVVIGKKRKTR